MKCDYEVWCMREKKLQHSIKNIKIAKYIMYYI